MSKNATLLADITAYLNYKESYLRPNSYKVYRNAGNKLARFVVENGFSELETRRVNAQFCERYKAHILRLHADPTTRNKEIGQMKGLFAHYTKAAFLRYKVSPAVSVELLPKQDSELHEPYTDEQTALIIGRIIEKNDYWLLLYIYLIHYTFSRPGREIRLMRVGDIKGRAIMIRPENSKTRRLKTPTIPKPVEQLLDFLNVRNYPKDWYIFGTDGVPGPVACGVNMYYTRHRVILDYLEIKGKYTLYGWKHTGNIRAISLGISERELQQQNGFKDFRTLEIYVRRLSAYTSSEIYDKFV